MVDFKAKRHINAGKGQKGAKMKLSMVIRLGDAVRFPKG